MLSNRHINFFALRNPDHLALQFFTIGFQPVHYCVLVTLLNDLLKYRLAFTFLAHSNFIANPGQEGWYINPASVNLKMTVVD